MSDFLETAMCRGTDDEVMEAIFHVAGEDDTKAEEIWEDPSRDDVSQIIEILKTHENFKELDWGDSKIGKVMDEFLG